MSASSVPSGRILCRGLDLRKLRDNTVEQRDSAHFATDLSDLGFGDLAVVTQHAVCRTSAVFNGCLLAAVPLLAMVEMFT
jgi:hypothetical protein